MSERRSVFGIEVVLDPTIPPDRVEMRDARFSRRVELYGPPPRIECSEWRPSSDGKRLEFTVTMVQDR